MTRKRLLMIVTSILVVGGLLMAFSINGDKQLSKEAKRNREYEVSLVKALKNSYRDIEEIGISNPEYSAKPENWHCVVSLTFSDGKTIEFGTSYDLIHEEFSKGGIMRQANGYWEYLMSKQGETGQQIKVTYSNGEKVVQ